MHTCTCEHPAAHTLTPTLHAHAVTEVNTDIHSFFPHLHSVDGESRRSRQRSNETRAGVKSSFAETMAATGLVFCTSSSFCYSAENH